MKPYAIELPITCTGPADELWALEFHTAEGVHRVHNMLRSSAEEIFADWKGGSTSLVKFCKLCPTQRGTDCRHDELPEQRGWFYREMTKVRIMPMREAV